MSRAAKLPSCPLNRAWSRTSGRRRDRAAPPAWRRRPGRGPSRSRRRSRRCRRRPGTDGGARAGADRRAPPPPLRVRVPIERTTNSSPPTRATVSLAADDGLEPARDALQHLVAGVVTADVVDLLEAVEVDDHQRERVRRPARALQRLLDPVVEQGPVREPRERVPERERLGRASAAGEPKCEDGGDRGRDREHRRRVRRHSTRASPPRRPAPRASPPSAPPPSAAAPAAGRLAPLFGFVLTPFVVLPPATSSVAGVRSSLTVWRSPRPCIATRGGSRVPRTRERVPAGSGGERAEPESRLESTRIRGHRRRRRSPRSSRPASPSSGFSVEALVDVARVRGPRRRVGHRPRASDRPEPDHRARRSCVALVVQTLRDPSVGVDRRLARGRRLLLHRGARSTRPGSAWATSSSPRFLGAWLGAPVIVALFAGSILALIPAIVILALHGKAGRKVGIPFAPVPRRRGRDRAVLRGCDPRLVARVAQRAGAVGRLHMPVKLAARNADSEAYGKPCRAFPRARARSTWPGSNAACEAAAAPPHGGG